MNLGRYQQGDWIPITVITDDASGNTSWPTDASGATVYPFVSILNPSLTHQSVVIADQGMPALNRDDANLLGYHRIWQRLGPEFPVGQYIVRVGWQSGSNSENRAVVHTFRVVAGGDDAGSYIAMTEYRVPHANHIVGFTDGGRLESRRNPRRPA